MKEDFLTGCTSHDPAAGDCKQTRTEQEWQQRRRSCCAKETMLLVSCRELQHRSLGYEA